MNNNNTQTEKKQVFSSDLADVVLKTTEGFKKSKNRIMKFTRYLNDIGDIDNAIFYDKLSKVEQLEYNQPLFKVKTLDNISDCGSWLEFHDYQKIETVTLHHANFCGYHKVCKSCAARRASKQVQKFTELLLTDERFLNLHAYYIVLPVLHDSSESFSTVFKRIEDALESVRNSRKNKRGQGFFRQFEGIMIAIEITKNKNGWNVHINMLALSKEPVSGLRPKDNTFVCSALIDEWQKRTDNNSYVVSINKLDYHDKSTLMKNLLEIFKYTLKFSDMSDEDLYVLYEETYGKRLLRGWGLFAKCGLKESIDLSNKELIGEEYIELILRYLHGDYIKHSVRKKIGENRFAAQRSKQSPIKRISNKSKFIEIVHLDKNGLTIQKTFKENREMITDYDKFKNSMRAFPRR